MSYVPKLPERNDNLSPENPLADLTWLLGASALILIAVWFALGFAVDYAVERLPPAFELRLLSKLPSPAFEQKAGPRADAAQRVFKRVTAAADAGRFELMVADDEAVNAFALPGGRIVVMHGLLAELQSENELAMVLGHELGHYAHRDHLRGLGRGLVLALLAAAVFGSDSGITDFAMSSLNVVNAAHSRRQETAADLHGLDLLQRSYGHVGGASEFFARALKDSAFDVGWLSTHPLSADRAAAVRAEAQRRGWREEQTVLLPP